MECEYFGSCGSCKIYPSYKEQLELKKTETLENFREFGVEKFDTIVSKDSHFRNRAEFRIWHDGEEINYAMNGFVKKEIVKINSCQIVNSAIYDLMPKIIEIIRANQPLKQRLFSIEFFSSNLGEILVTLIYHRKIDDSWREFGKILEDNLNIRIIGRSRKTKIVISDDFITEELTIFDKTYQFKIYENSFTQPNGGVNSKMIEWVKSNIKDGNDLIESYCGHGNFTIPLSDRFNRVLATEISKTSIKSAKINCELNSINSIEFIRLSSSELSQAIDEVREFRRLEHIELNSYNFSHLFVDPPRAGLDEESITLAKRFENIIYISCNPLTLQRDLKELTKEYKIINFAIFDQFAYTHHIETGVILKKI